MVKSSPINITKGFGRSHNLIFRLEKTPNNLQQSSCFNKRQRIILSAFNIVNKDAGYYQLDIKSGTSPSCLTMGPYKFEFIARSKNSNKCLISRMQVQLHHPIFI